MILPTIPHVFDYNKPELEKAMKRLELLSNRKNIVIIRCHAKTTLYIKSITRKRDKIFLRRYFSNENQSGGGDIIGDPVLLNDGKEAIVKFKQPEGNVFYIF